MSMQPPEYTGMRRTSVRRAASNKGDNEHRRSFLSTVSVGRRERSRQTKRVAVTENSVIDAHLLEFESESEEAESDEDDFLMTGTQTLHDPRHRTFYSNSVYFKSIVGVMIMANTIVIALEALYIEYQYVFFDQLELFFTFFYVFELAWRIWERGLISFLSTDDWWWSWFDLLITGLSLADTFIGAHSGKSAGASVGRLFRVFRILRMFRAFKFMNEVDYVLAHAAKATFKLSIVVWLVLFVASIIATNMLWDCPDPIVARMFGDLRQSLWSMFKLMTLDDWVPVSERVIKVRPGMMCFFVVFIFSTSIALISLVPAIFIEISLNSREREDALNIERERSQRRRQKTRLLRTLFKLSDRNGNGKVSCEEMKTVLTNDSYLRQLQDAGLTEAGDLRDVRLGLFDLWEEALEETARTDHEITEEDFISGLLRMREEVSQATLWRCTTASRLMLRDFSSYVRKELREIRYNTGHLEKEMKEIINSTRTEILNLKALIADATSGEQGEGRKLLRGGSALSASTEQAKLLRGASASSAATAHSAASGFGILANRLGMGSSLSTMPSSSDIENSVMGGSSGPFARAQDFRLFKGTSIGTSTDTTSPRGQPDEQTATRDAEKMTAATRDISILEGHIEQGLSTAASTVTPMPGSGSNQNTAAGSTSRQSPRQIHPGGTGAGYTALPRLQEEAEEALRSTSPLDQAGTRGHGDVPVRQVSISDVMSDSDSPTPEVPGRFGL